MLRLLCAAMLLLGGTADAAEPPAWTIQVDPLTTALGYAHLQVERAVAGRVSVYAGPHLRLYDSVFSDEEEPFKGYGLEVGVRVFWDETAPAGAWAQVRGVGAWLQTDDGAESGPGGYGSALVGWTGIFAGRWVLSGGAGVQYLHSRVGDYGPEGLFPALHTTVGVAF